MEERLRCSVCGVNLTDDTVNHFDGEIYCDRCFDERTVECECCGTRIRREDSNGGDYIVLCNRCYDYSYTNCENCGLLIHNDDARYFDDEDYPYCLECYNKISDRAIKNYSYKPETIFYGDRKLYYGIELEIDKGGEDDTNARKILDVANCEEERIYCKHDASIDNGFEIVSHAATIDYHLNNFPWKDIMVKAIEMRYRSHNTSTCGLHIHASREDFGDTYEQQEEAIARLANRLHRKIYLKIKYYKDGVGIIEECYYFDRKYKARKKVVPQMLTSVFVKYDRRRILDIVNRELDCDFTDVIIADNSIDIEKNTVAICGNI